MDLYEFQARELFAKYGVPVLPGIVAYTPDEAAVAARELGENVVVKAQVKTGGRGKAGGVRIARSVDQARELAERILALTINGFRVESVLIAPAVEVAAEFYFSILLDRAARGFVALCSTAGGIEIEEIASEHPERLAKVPIDPLTGLDTSLAARITDAAQFPLDVAVKVRPVLVDLYRLFHDEDATLVEVNPLVLTAAGEIVALDGKVTLDESAHFRQPHQQDLIGTAHLAPLEDRANELGLGYVKLDGSVGVIGNGAGLVMSTLDLIAAAGKAFEDTHPANFLDIGGGASAEIMTDSLAIVLRDPQVKSVLINVFGGITACDTVAEGILQALDTLGKAANKPIVVRLDGYRAQAGRAILEAANHPCITVVETMDAAAETATQLAHAQVTKSNVLTDTAGD